jgi:hypothetical protein
VVQCLQGYTDDQISDVAAPPVDLGGEAPPPGFDTMEQYRTYKCQAANAVVDAVKGLFVGIAGMAGLQFAAATIGPALIALLSGIGAIDIVFPPGFVVTMVAAIVACGVLFGTSFIVFQRLADYIEDNRPELVCSLYNSGSAAQAQEAIAAIVEDFIQTSEFAALLGGPSTPQGLAFGSLTAQAVPNAVVNPLFTLVEGLTYPGADCDGCELPRSEITVEEDPYDGGGGIITRSGDHIHITAEFVEAGDPYGQWYHTFFKFVTPGTEDGICTDMTNWSDNLQQAHLSDSSSFLKCQGGYENISTLPIVVPEVGVTNVYIRSDVPFWVEFDISIHS